MAFNGNFLLKGCSLKSILRKSYWRFSLTKYIVGRVIREFRKKQHVSQTELCRGICSVSSLSRIESGDQMPPRKVAETLLSRLGRSPGLYDTPLTKADLKMSELEIQIAEHDSRGLLDYLPLLNEYKNQKERLDDLENQCYLMYLARYEFRRTGDTSAALDNYKRAMKLSLPDYTIGSSLSGFPLSRTEIDILFSITSCLNLLGRNEESVEILKFLQQQYETREIDEIEMANMYPVVLCNLACWYESRQDVDKALELFDRGMQICADYGRLTFYCYNMLNKGELLLKKGNKDEGKTLLSLGLFILDERGDHEEAVSIAKQIKAEFDLTLPEK